MIVLVGFMGAGKTTVGRILASLVGLPFVDTDEQIEKSAGTSINEIFASGGEPAFRALEREALASTLNGDKAVVSVGGGALGDPRTRTDLEWHDVVLLDVEYSEALRRIGGSDNRPMLASGDRRALFDERRRTYERTAAHVVATDGKRPEEVAKEIAGLLGIEVEENLRRIVVDLPRPYEVVVGRHLLERMENFLPEGRGAESAFVVSHPSLRALAEPVMASLKKRGLKARLLEVPEGEGAKSLDQAQALYAQLADAPAHRHDLVIAVGGGVVTDLTAFIASTYNRGMPVVHIATSLLAQVDAAIGGKTGVNLAAGKNLVGTIHQPELVVCDVEVLGSLPAEEFTSGMAEVVKYGFIRDPQILDLVEKNLGRLKARDPELLVDIVARSAAIKAGIVAIDERETGVRALLNYGHTFAHAIEHSGDFAIRHGHAVALGMMAAAYLAHEMGRIGPEVVERHRQVLGGLGLPVAASLDIDALEKAWVRDKKYKGGVKFVLLSALGVAEAGIAAPRPAVLQALERMAS